MNITQLTVFCQVAEAKSLSRVAVATGTAPSLISRKISQLEAEWGARLFDRTGRGMALSSFGQRMYPATKELLVQFDELAMSAVENSGVLRGTVHIGVPPSISRQLLTVLFADIRLKAPSIRLHVTEGFSGSLDEHLAAGRLDMAVLSRYGSSAWRGDDIMGWMETCLVGRPNPNLTGRTVPFKSLAGIPLVLPPLPNGLRSILDQLAHRHDMTLNIAIEVETLTSMKDVALSGAAWTLLPRMAVQDEIHAGTLVAMTIEKPAIRRVMALGLSRQRPLSGAKRLVAQRIRALAPALLKPAPTRTTRLG
jgi:DNA-binding transcriptional LysR family regulator